MNTPASPGHPEEPEATSKLRSLSRVRFWLLMLLFLGLTVAGCAWAIYDSGLDADVLSHLVHLPAPWLTLLLLLSASLIFAEMVRLRVAGRILGETVPWRASLDAAIANNFFSWITPGSALGEPATIAMLGRGGVPWDVAGLVAYGKSITGLVFFTGLAFVMLGLGLGPALGTAYYLPFLTATGVVLFFGGLLVLGATRPDATNQRVARIRTSLGRQRLLQGPRATRALDALHDNTTRAIDRLGRFRHGRIRGGLLLITLTHIFYYGSFLGVLITLAHIHGAPNALALTPHAIIYQTFTYFAPTPGGAGLSEATAAAFFDTQLTPANAVLVVLLYRSLTFYFHVLLGFLYLPGRGAGARPLGRAETALAEEE